MAAPRPLHPWVNEVLRRRRLHRRPQCRGRLQFLDAAVNTAADLALGQKREPALDLIEPGGVGGSEVKVIARPFGKPGFDRRRLVGGVIVHDQMDIEIGRHGSVDGIEEAAELGARGACGLATPKPGPSFAAWPSSAAFPLQPRSK